MVMELWSPHSFSFPFCLEPGNESETFSELESCDAGSQGLVRNVETFIPS